MRGYARGCWVPSGGTTDESRRGLSSLVEGAHCGPGGSCSKALPDRRSHRPLHRTRKPSGTAPTRALSLATYLGTLAHDLSGGADVAFALRTRRIVGVEPPVRIGMRRYAPPYTPAAEGEKQESRTDGCQRRKRRLRTASQRPDTRLKQTPRRWLTPDALRQRRRSPSSQRTSRRTRRVPLDAWRGPVSPNVIARRRSTGC